MGLLLEKLELYNWRNFSEKTLQFSPELTILEGQNAVGKTNTLEAIQLLLSGKSFRNSRREELVKKEANEAKAKLTITGDMRELHRSVVIAEGKRSFTQNKKPLAPAHLSDEVQPVVFTPDHLRLIKDGASKRRKEIDEFGSLAHPGYKRLLHLFQRVLLERNAYLKYHQNPSQELDALNQAFVDISAKLLVHRLSLFEKLATSTVKLYHHIVSRETLSISYIPSWGNVEKKEDFELKIAQSLQEALLESQHDDFHARVTTVGPHRDDIVFCLNKEDARLYASQGQQRSIVLAWKLAQIDLIRSLLCKTPLLLLDDVMSELDATRREDVALYLTQDVQTVITTTNLQYFSEPLLRQAKVVHYE